MPLTVVGRIWLEEVLVIDVLDKWIHQPKIDTKLVIVSDESNRNEADNLLDQGEDSQVIDDNLTKGN